MKKTCYLAHPQFKEALRKELPSDSIEKMGMFFSSTYVNSVWALDIWKDCTVVYFESISEAARILRSQGKYWAFYPVTAIRRGRLIEEKLPRSAKSTPFPSSLPSIGGWTLLDEHHLLYSTSTSKPFPLGIPNFVENKTTPPSRAYLKLYEALSIGNAYPTQSDAILEVGASPGSWTFVLAELGGKVTAVDRSPLDAKIARYPNVSFVQKDGFSFLPSNTPKLDWILSDMACYPEKLFVWVKTWLESGLCSNFVITVKLQGTNDKEAIKLFASLPGCLLHLYHNKHELTWIKLKDCQSDIHKQIQ